MQSKHVGLIIVLLLIGAGYLWMFNARRVPALQGMFVELPGAAATFSFNDSVVFTEIKVVKAAKPAAEGEVYTGEPEDELVWHLVEREPEPDKEPEAIDKREVRALAYGRRVRGLRPAENSPRRGEPLVRGAEYIFYGTLADDYGGGVLELPFTPGGKSDS